MLTLRLAPTGDPVLFERRLRPITPGEVPICLATTEELPEAAGAGFAASGAAAALPTLPVFYAATFAAWAAATMASIFAPLNFR